MRTRNDELETKLSKLNDKIEKKSKKKDHLDHLCLTLPIHLEMEELVVLQKQGSIFDEKTVKEAVMLGFATSRQVS